MKTLKTPQILFIIIIIMLYTSCNENGKSMRPMRSGETFNLKKEDLQDFKKKGMLGSADLAFKVYQYYTFYKQKRDLSRYWLMISAENGHRTAQYNFAIYNLDEKNYNRARFWAQKALKNGEKEAEELFDVIKQRESD